MKNFNSIKRLTITIIITLALASVSVVPAYSGNLFIEPASPLVEVGGEITLSVTNASGEVRWNAFDGEIEKTGNSVIYKAPNKVAIDMVSAKDSAGNSGFVNVVVQEKPQIDEQFSRENANWKIFTNRSEINTLLLSDDGTTLWVGTNGGLEKRDALTGKLIQVFTNIDGLLDNYIVTLLSDNNGGLWIGTLKSGLAHLKPDGTWKIFHTHNSGLPGNEVRTLLSDSSGGLWIGTFGGGLAHLKSDQTWDVFNEENLGLQDNYIYSLLSDGSGGLWIGASGGLIHFKSDGTRVLFNTQNSGLPDDYIATLLSDNSGGLWIGTYGGGVAHLKSDGTWETFNSQNSGLQDNCVNSLLSDGSGGLWIGTGGALAHFKSDRTWDLFNSQNMGLLENGVETLLSDSNGGLWIGTQKRGLVHFKSDGTWEMVNSQNAGLPDNQVKTLLSDGRRGLWIGTYGGGIAGFKSDGTWALFHTQNSDLSENGIETLLSDSNGGLWIGTQKSGIAHFKSDGTWALFHTQNSDLSENGIETLLSDSNGGLWIGTQKSGIAHFKSDGKWELLNTQNSGLPENEIKTLLSDGSNGLWIGTQKSGIAHFKSDGKWELLNTQNSGLPENEIKTLLSDGSNGLWIGTEYGYLAHFKSDKTWQVFNWLNSDLPDESIETLLSDNSGGLWIGTSGGGLVRFKSDGKWDLFNTQSSGLPDNDVNALLSDGNGGLWVGTSGGGLAHLTFSTSQIQDEQYLKNGRAAIIIAGGGNTDDNALWDSTVKISNYAYKMLNKRGFLNTDIHYISPQPFADFNGDGLDDGVVDSPTPARQIQLSDIQAAFDWAKTKGELNQPLYIFFTDHGGVDKLQLSQGVYIKASELKTMLDDYQKTTGNKVVVIIDACHSGTMVKALAGENRAVISSTNDGAAYFDRLNGQSFTWYVTKGINKGMNFSEAFYYASSEYKKTLGKVSQYESIAAGSDTLNLTQEPQFDDNGDGLYNISVDGNWLKTVSVNGTWSNADVTLTVEAVTQSGVVSASGSGGDSSSVPLKAKATLANGRVTRAWAVIRPPKMDILFDSTTGTPILAFPKIDLSSSTTEGEENIYQGSWNGFVYNGEYEITFYAEDNDKNIEGSESIILTVADGLACPEKGSLKVSTDKQPDTTGKITYKSGDKLKISVTENLAYGYDLYAALLMPDGNFTALKSPLTNANINYLQKENFNKLYWGDRWIETNRNINMGKAVDVVDLTLSDDVLNQGYLSQGKLPSGQYCVYAALIPEGQDLVVSAEKGLFVLDGVCFEVETHGRASLISITEHRIY